jgi:hypothetical protein
MEDATDEDYPHLLDRLVLSPLGLADSHVSKPLDPRLAAAAARAVGPDGSPLDGGWRVNPELAAGGLWSTPSDIARLLIAIARALRGEAGSPIGADAAAAMVTRGPGNWGLGVDLGPAGPVRRLSHSGHTHGFVSEYVLYPDSCQGAVMMTNADQGGWLAAELLRAIGEVRNWPGRTPPPVQAAVPLTPAIRARFEGMYRLRDFPAERFTVSRRGGGLYWARVGFVGRELLAAGEGRLFSPDSRMTLEAEDPGAARARTLSLSFGGGTNVAERIGD